MTDNQKKLLDLLKDMFQFDQADLDFGIYRIMNLKRAEVSDFLNNKLIAQISEGIRTLVGTDNQVKIEEIESQIEAAKSFPMPETAKAETIAALRRQIASLSVTDISGVEADVYNHLINFFSRYYDEGDFISQRRYKEGVYAIPYEGEEVKLHWANADQYYVKTSEYFSDYTFKDSYGEKTVIFKIVDAETERDNNKASEKRFFCLHEESPFELSDDGKTLTVFVEYRASSDFKKQEDANQQIYAFLKNQFFMNAEWSHLFAQPSSKEKSDFEKHLFRYTAKNTYDYFIHKDLGGFLRRELDFYIKNEVIFLDDISVDDMAKTREYLVKAQVIKDAARRIIDFLAQIENFQKKLYLKKKFVVDTQYCITLDRIPEEFYPEIIANDAQREEWVRLFAIDEIQYHQGDMFSEDKEGYSVPLTLSFLKQNQFLVLDTALFRTDFKERLIECIDDLDNAANGLMINSENYQALNLLSTKYRRRVQGCYIDPPFNLGEDADYLYKVNYKDSSWLTLLNDRLVSLRGLLKDDGFVFVRCSHDGNMILRMLLDTIFGKENYRNEIILRRAEESKGDLNKQFDTIRSITVNYDNLYWYSNSPSARYEKIVKPVSSVNSEAHWHSFWKAMDRPTMRYELLGIDLSKHYGQWMWSKERAMCAVENYQYYQSVIEPQGISLEDYWASSGKDKEFVRRDGNGFTSIKYWIPPRTEIMADTNWLDIKGYANKWGFKTENSEGVVKRVIDNICSKGDIVIDFFMGSGTTAAVSLKTQRFFIGVEMGEHFDSILMPRLKNVLYGETSGISDTSVYSGGGLIKYLRLESYEDTLSNISFDTGSIELLPAELRDDYVLKYMLEDESRKSLFNVDSFAHPFNYAMSISRKQESKWTTVDLVETFNYLIGLIVERSYARTSYDATFSYGEYGVLKATVSKGSTYTLKLVEGHSLNGDKILVIWRDMTGDSEKDNAVLSAVLERLKIDSKDKEYNRIYVNGDNNIPNLNGNTVFLIEDEMQARMFDVN